MKRRIFRVLPWLLMAAALAPALLIVAPGLVGAERAEVVVSGSMSPTIGAGDLVVIDAVGSSGLRVGDVIAFRSGGDASMTVLHRIIEVRTQGVAVEFITKGDANEEADPQPVPANDVFGIYRFRIPWYGHAVAFAKTPTGVLVLVVMPSVLVVVSEIWRLAATKPADQVRP